MNRVLAKFVLPLSQLASKSTFSSSSSLVTSSTASGKIRRKSKQVKNLLLLASSDAELSVRYHKLSNKKKKPKELHFPNTVRSRHFFPSFSCNAFFLGHLFEEAALWNPTTDEIKFLPESSVPRPPWTRNTYFCYGFGFDHHHYDYKVIRFIDYMCLEDDTENTLVELYSLKRDSWKEVMFPHISTPPGIQGVHINGIFYWLAGDGVILSFDMTTEEFPSISTPLIPLPQTDLLNYFNNNLILAEFNGQLATIVHSNLESLCLDSFHIQIWVWNHESWSRVLSNVSIVSGVAYCKLLGFFNNVELYVQSWDGEVVCVDCATGELKFLGLFVDSWRASLFPYVESGQPIQV
ncbi:F-box family protein [Striga asiatica]|uniref:F-box family protein n=1 Tax=Striga asiatica TaxID=4170 RepID=A0A5A7RF16_STRAF|nr:F-box family protein [Striga asiatica]